MNDTLFRQWTMLRHIPRHPRKVDTMTLKQRLEEAGYTISLRSIQRDLVKLSDVLPLLADDAKPQGWSWSSEATQWDLPSLEPQAALTFKLVEDYMRPLLPISTLSYLQPWFHTAQKVLDAHGNGLAKWPSKIRVLPKGFPLLPPGIDLEAQETIYQGLLAEKRVKVSYLPRDAEELKEYVVNPLALVVRDQIIYLVCTMWEYQDIRHLVLHRIWAAELLDDTATRPMEFDLDAHIRRGEFGFPLCDDKIHIEVRFNRDAANTLYEYPLSEDQTIKDLDEEHILMEATVLDTAELRWWLQGFGDQVVVVGPEALRDEFASMARNLAASYKKSS